MTKLQERLFAMQDKEYALFQAKLTPDIPMERFIGVRVPLLRAFAKQWNATIPYLQDKRLATWTHNKTIQKACESYRITAEQKLYLKTLKIK